MAAQVVTSPHFAARMDAAKLEELKVQGLLVQEPTPYDDLELSDPEYGEEIIGTLTNEEEVLFCSMYECTNKLDDLSRELGSNFLIKSGEAVRDGKEKDLQADDLVSVEIASDYFRTHRQVEYLRSLLYWTISERFKCHDYTIGIRTKRRIVKSQRKW